MAFRVTYQIITPESAEIGDAEEHGFIMPGEWRYDVSNSAPMTMSLREAVDLVGCVEDSGSWFTETDGRQNYQTGAVEIRSLHPPASITPSSYARLARLLNV